MNPLYNMEELLKVIDEQMKKTPDEMKKLKKKMRKWQHTPLGRQKIQFLMDSIQPPQSEEEEKEEVDPRQALRDRIKAMEKQRHGKNHRL